MKMQLTSAIFHMSFLYGHVAIYVPKDEKVRISKYVVIRMSVLSSHVPFLRNSTDGPTCCHRDGKDIERVSSSSFYF